MSLFLVPLLLSIGLAGFLLHDSEKEDDQPADETPPKEPNDGPDLLDPVTGADPVTPLPVNADGKTILQADDSDSAILANDRSEVIYAGGGNDSVIGRGGDDEIFLGQGDDQHFYRSGPKFDGDLVPGYGKGDDLIRGGGGRDSIKDDEGADTLYGDASADVLDARDTAGRDPQSDTLFGGAGDDLLIGDDGDILDGGLGTDSYYIATDDVDADPVIISDIQPGERIVIALNGASEDDLSADLADDNASINLRLEGRIVAKLFGIDGPADLTADVSGRQSFDILYVTKP